MNSFGRIFRLTIFGESHGPSVGISIDGCPAGLPLKEEDFSKDLERRKGGLQNILVEATILEVGGEKNVEQGLQKAIEAKDSVGGIIECSVKGLPVGLGEPFFDSVESVISHAVFSIPAIKGIEFGAGFGAAK